MKPEITKHADSHYVSHDDKLDTAHATVADPGPDPAEVSQDGLGIVQGKNSQQATDNSSPRKIGGEDERVKIKSRVTLGTHRTSEPGFAKADSRHAHVKNARKENQKAFAEKK